MRQNHPVFITKHAIDRFIERFGPINSNGYGRDSRHVAERFLSEIWRGAFYVADDEEGILFRNAEFGCDIIVQDKKMITVFHPNERRERRMRQSSRHERHFCRRPKRHEANSVYAPDDVHIPPALKAKMERRKS